MLDKVDWNDVKIGRSDASRLLPSILKLPLIKNHRDLLTDLIEDGQSLLDIGANNRSLLEYLKLKTGKKFFYKSYDIDKTLEHDYYDIEDINQGFDIITILEVIEHMSVNEVRYLFSKANALLNKGGTIVISTPNVYHPVRFWRDCTHITPFAYDELVGLLVASNFSHFDVYRVKSNMKLKDWARYWLYKPFIKLMGIDFAPGIVVVARSI